MAEYDRLPEDLRQWLASAILPWGTRSALRAYERALARTGCGKAALQELDRMQNNLISKDARQVWGEAHPAVG